MTAPSELLSRLRHAIAEYDERAQLVSNLGKHRQDNCCGRAAQAMEEAAKMIADLAHPMMVATARPDPVVRLGLKLPLATLWTLVELLDREEYPQTAKHGHTALRELTEAIAQMEGDLFAARLQREADKTRIESLTDEVDLLRDASSETIKLAVARINELEAERDKLKAERHDAVYLPTLVSGR